MMTAANYETAVGSASQCRGMSNMSVQISPKMIYLVRARVNVVFLVLVVVVVVVVVEVNGSWVRGGGRRGDRSRQKRIGQCRRRQNKTGLNR